MKCPHCQGSGQVTGTLGKRLYELRKNGRMTIAEAAKRCGLTKGALDHLERDHAKNPGVLTIMKLAEMYGVKIQDLFDE